MVFNYVDYNINRKIGSLDLETYSSFDDGFGKLEVYAGGCSLSDGYKRFYYIDGNKDLYSGDDIIIRMFEDLFNYIAEDKKSRNGYTLYAHNLGRFDSVFLLKSLTQIGSDIKCKWKDNAILQIKIRDTERKLNVKLLDSIKIVPQSLEKVLKSFGCDINKGIFPHKFVNEKTLNYIGPKPDIKYYLDSSKIHYQKLAVYDNIPNEFNLKEQCLDYLNKDVLGLLEVMIKLNEYYYSKFNINITKYPTIASLTIGVYGYWFSKDIKNPIKMIKGPLEKFIRQAYFGGNS